MRGARQPGLHPVPYFTTFLEGLHISLSQVAEKGDVFGGV